MERLFLEFWSTGFNHFFKKNRFNCHGKNLENSFFSKIISICARFFQPEQKLSGHSVKKSSWLSKLHSTHLEVHFEEFWLSEEDFCFHFRTLRKKDSDFCSLKTPMLSELHSTNPKLLFRTFLWKNLILKVFSDFERNRFRPLKTLYSQNCSRIWGQKSPNVSQKNLSRVANLHSTCPQVHLVHCFSEM